MPTHRLSVLAVLALAGGLAAAQPAVAKVYAVNVASDGQNSTCAPFKACSLRSALALADDDDTHDTIRLPAGARLELAQGQLESGNGTGVRELEIDGRGATIDGNGASGILRLTGNSDDEVTLRNLTLTGGANPDSGGAVDADDIGGGKLILLDVAMTGNTAAVEGGAVVSGQSNALVVERSTFTQNTAGAGGAISGNGPTTIKESTFTGNTATDSGGRGGGAFSFSSASLATLVDSTFTGNHAAERSGAIHIRGDLVADRITVAGNDAPERGGIGLDLNPGEHVAISNATVTGNAATVGEYGAAGIGLAGSGATSTLSIDSSTIAGNTVPAGAAAGTALGTYLGPVTLRNTILSGPRACNVLGPMTSKGGNLDSGRTCAFNGPDDRFDADPRLGPLADNGGAVPTMALLAGSAAVDAGLACPALDAREVSRPQGPACDSGAFEAEKADLVTTLAAAPAAVKVGEPVTASVTVTDRAAHDAPSTVLTLEPSGVPVAVQSAATSAGTCTTAVPVSCQLGTLETESPVTVTVVVVPQAAGALALTAAAVNARPDATPADDRAQATVDVAALPVPAGDPPAGQGPSPAPGAPGAPAADVGAPTVTAGARCTKRLKRVRRARACIVRVALDEAGTVTGKATMAVRARGRVKRITVARGRLVLTAAGEGRLVLRLTAAGRRRLAGRRRATLRLALSASDAAQNRTTATRKLVLKG